MTGTYNFVSLIEKMILLELASLLLAPAVDKTQHFIYLSFNSILQLINGILKDLQVVHKYFNDTAISAFLKIPFDPLTSVFPNNLVFYSKDLTLLLFSNSGLKLVTSSRE